MKESIFDLQADISNLIVKHGLEDGEYGFIYRNKQLLIVDLSNIKVDVPEQKEETLSGVHTGSFRNETVGIELYQENRKLQPTTDGL
jgi:hypothetical protein